MSNFCLYVYLSKNKSIKIKRQTIVTDRTRKKCYSPIGGIWTFLTCRNCSSIANFGLSGPSIVAEYGFDTRFDPSVEQAAAQLPSTIDQEEIAKRKDYRKVTTFTIDPVDAKDFDDAISFQALGDDKFEIGVHIADVSHYLKEGTVLDDEAYERATSVYLVDRVVPMLPEILSNGACSLRPHEEKYTFAAVFEMNDKISC